MSFSSGIISPRINDSLERLLILAWYCLIVLFSSIRRFLNLEISNYILDFHIVAVPSNLTCSMSQASLVDSLAEMLLNCVGLTPLNMALRAFQLLDDYLFSSTVQLSSLLGTSFPDSSFLMGGVQLVRIAFLASSSLDLLNARMRAF